VSLKRYRYTGKERDEETGFYYHGARYYAPWLGRWTSCDPAGLADGVNSYRYARNSPIRYTDPEGTESLPPRSADVGSPHLVPTGEKDTPIWKWYGEVGDLIISEASKASFTLPDGSRKPIPPEKILFVIAHARAETVTQGTKPLGLNYFNIQGGDGTAGHEDVERDEYLPKKDQKPEQGQPVEMEWRKVKTTTRAYNTGQEAVQDYFEDLKANRSNAFASLVSSTETVQQFVQGLKTFGTHPQYKERFLKAFNNVVEDYKKLTDEQIRMNEESLDQLKTDLGKLDPANAEGIAIFKREIQHYEKRIEQLKEFKRKISEPGFKAVIPAKAAKKEK